MPESYSRDHRKDHRLERAGRVFHLSAITVGVREQFCEWLLRSMLRRAAAAYASDGPDPKAKAAADAAFRAYRDDLFANPPAWDVVPSDAVRAAFASTAGQLQINRLLLDVGPAEMPDADLLAWIGDTEDATSEYATLLKLVIEGADPKAGTAGASTGCTPTPAATCTPPSSTSPSTLTPPQSAG